MFGSEELVIIASIPILVALLTQIEKVDGIFLLSFYILDAGSFSLSIIFTMLKMLKYFENNYYIFVFIFGIIILLVFMILYVVCKKTGWMFKFIRKESNQSNQTTPSNKNNQVTPAKPPRKRRKSHR